MSQNLRYQVGEQIHHRYYSLSTRKTHLLWVKFLIHWHLWVEPIECVETVIGLTVIYEPNRHLAHMEYAHSAMHFVVSVYSVRHPCSPLRLRRQLALLGAILAAQRIVHSGRKCGHFREQPYEPLAAQAGFAASVSERLACSELKHQNDGPSAQQ